MTETRPGFTFIAEPPPGYDQITLGAGNTLVTVGENLPPLTLNEATGQWEAA